MCWSYASQLKKIVLTALLFSLISCGNAYFPIELKTIKRSERIKGQEKISIKLVSMTRKSILVANRAKYERRVIFSSDLSKPAQLIMEKDAIIERYPDSRLSPGPYLIGPGDSLLITEKSSVDQKPVSRQLEVSDDGNINIYEIGQIKVAGLTQSEIEDLIRRSLIESSGSGRFELSINAFNSKKIYVVSTGGNSIIPYTNIPTYLKEILISNGNVKPTINDTEIKIQRAGNEYTISLLSLFNDQLKRVRIFPEDKVFIYPLNYKQESVLIVGETGAQTSSSIDSVSRKTLADTLFNNNMLNIVSSDFSQIYVIRDTESFFSAYHLDITDPARISLAKKFEMRPDDIVFVAAQPLSLYSRALSQILGSTALSIDARDQIRAEVQ